MVEEFEVEERCPECGETTKGGGELHLTPQGRPVLYHPSCWQQYHARLQWADAEPCAACGSLIPRFGELVLTIREGETVRRYHARCAPVEDADD